jgi:hypothetical protein
MNFKHGDRVKCTIDGTDIDEARISIDKDGTPFICQNETPGDSAEDMFEYKYSWKLDDNVTNLRSAKKSFDSPKIGDEYIDAKGNSRFVLGVAGRVIFLSSPLSKDDFCSILTKEQLIILGYTIANDKPKEEPTEMTLEDIEKLVGKKVKIVEKK